MWPLAAPDPYTVRVTYEKRFAPGLASWGIGIIPKHIYGNGDFNTHPANRAPIGTGPYCFKEWKTDQYILLEANPDYFEGNLSFNDMSIASSGFLRAVPRDAQPVD